MTFALNRRTSDLDMLLLGGPSALAECKRLVRRVPQLPRDEALRVTSEWSARTFRSAEAAEGMAAFREKRKPAWVSGAALGGDRHG